MIEIRTATEDEVISAFLQSEVDASRYGESIAALLKLHRRDRTLIDTPLLTDVVDNEVRRRIFAAYRGYPNQLLFQGFPTDVRWRRTVGASRLCRRAVRKSPPSSLNSPPAADSSKMVHRTSS
jgi:hypothetical protein